MRTIEQFEGVTPDGLKYYGVTVQTEKTMSANARQVGGSHYAKDYQHWDWVPRIGLDYLGGCATKYLDRWREKNGLPDLEKASHYLEKLIEVAPMMVHQRSNLNSDYIEEETTEFLDGCNVPQREAKIFMMIAMWTKRSHLTKARRRLEALIDDVREEQAAQQRNPDTNALVTLRQKAGGDFEAHDYSPRAG